MEQIITRSGIAKHQMYLDNSKVWKRCRQIRSDLYILRLRINVRREVGMRWQEFGRKYVRDEQHQQVEIQFRKMKGNLWEVTLPRNMEVRIKDQLYHEFGA